MSRKWIAEARADRQWASEDDQLRMGLPPLDMLASGAISGVIDDAESAVAGLDLPVVFAHNDMLPANIMVKEHDVALIDFEYSNVNYRGSDFANFFNEWAGGSSEEDGGVCDWGRLPSESQMRDFCAAYLGVEVDSEEVTGLLKEADRFVVVNHAFWGVWAVVQAREEGCEGFDYLRYAASRFQRLAALRSGES